MELCNCSGVVHSECIYSRTSMARTLMACLPCLSRTRSWISMVPYMILLWSNFCIYVFMLLFSFSIFNDLRNTKNSDCRYLIYGTRVPRAQLYIETNTGWLELSLNGNNFHGPKPVGAIEVLLCIHLNYEIIVISLVYY